MLNASAFSAYCDSLQLSEAAVNKIQAIRASEPIRHVTGRASNVCARYPSHKMGRVIQAESRTVELVAIRCAYEFEPQVFEFWDQPCQIQLDYLARHGRLVHVHHTPDFFVLRQACAGWEEWKSLSQLAQLAEQMPNRYQQVTPGQWRCPPGEAYAAQFGLYYALRTSAEFSPTYQRNVAFLEDYLVATPNNVDHFSAQQIAAAVQEQPGVTLVALQERFSSDDVFHALATGLIRANLETAALVHPDQVTIFPPSQLAEVMVERPNVGADGRTVQIDQLQVGDIVLWDQRPWQILNVGLTQLALMAQGDEGQLVEVRYDTVKQLVRQGSLTLPVAARAASNTTVLERIRQASPTALARAMQRTQVVEALLAGQKPETAYADRTLRHYKRRYLEAQLALGSGFVGLLDRNANKGNRTPRLTPTSQALLTQFITESYETLKQKSILCVYAEYVSTCEQQGVSAASYTTFAKQVHNRPQVEQVRKRQGERAAYQVKPPVWWLEADTPRHGDFPWQYGHLDHTQINLEIVCATTGRSLGRPWLTLLIDAWSRRILAVYITFDPPSYRSCMAILVECVRRHQRMPQHIMVDNSSEFRSTYFETLLAHYGVTKLSRPTAQPRTGSLIERLFHTSETEFVHNLRGNTQVMKQARLVTSAVNPKQHAIWTLGLFYEYFCTWSYEVYDQMEHTALGQSPRNAYLTGLAVTGLRSHRQIADDETFRILMLPTTQRGQAKVIPGSGVKINYLYYWCDAFRKPTIERSLVSVKYDPFNAGIAYAYVNGCWERCISERYVTFQGRSEREMAIATATLRQQKRLQRQRFDINAKTLAAFLASVEGQEVLLEQQLKDNETRQVRATILGGPQPTMSDSEQRIQTIPSQPAAPMSTTHKVDRMGLEHYGALDL